MDLKRYQKASKQGLKMDFLRRLMALAIGK